MKHAVMIRAAYALQGNPWVGCNLNNDETRKPYRMINIFNDTMGTINLKPIAARPGQANRFAYPLVNPATSRRNPAHVFTESSFRHLAGNTAHWRGLASCRRQP